jgi:hypothetical protein
VAGDDLDPTGDKQHPSHRLTSRGNQLRAPIEHQGSQRVRHDAHRRQPTLDFLGTTLLEVKSGRLDEGRYLDELIQQVLTYALLAHHDGRTVTHVAVYAARYQRLLRYRVQDLIVRLADTPVDLTAAGRELAALIPRGRHCRSAA